MPKGNVFKKGGVFDKGAQSSAANVSECFSEISDSHRRTTE